MLDVRLLVLRVATRLTVPWGAGCGWASTPGMAPRRQRVGRHALSRAVPPRRRLVTAPDVLFKYRQQWPSKTCWSR